MEKREIRNDKSHIYTVILHVGDEQQHTSNKLPSKHNWAFVGIPEVDSSTSPEACWPQRSTLGGKAGPLIDKCQGPVCVYVGGAPSLKRKDRHCPPQHSLMRHA